MAVSGSETLHQWQKLAAADMSAALFEHRPGVVPRGESSVVGSGATGSVRSGLGVGALGSFADDSLSVYSGPAGSFVHDVEEDDVTFSYSSPPTSSITGQPQQLNKNSKS